MCLLWFRFAESLDAIVGSCEFRFQSQFELAHENWSASRGTGESASVIAAEPFLIARRARLGRRSTGSRELSSITLLGFVSLCALNQVCRR